MAYTNDQLNTLENAIAQGARRVKYGDKEVEYMSLAEMLQARNIMRAELGLDNKSRRTFGEFNKGL